MLIPDFILMFIPDEENYSKYKKKGILEIFRILTPYLHISKSKFLNL